MINKLSHLCLQHPNRNAPTLGIVSQKMKLAMSLAGSSRSSMAQTRRPRGLAVRDVRAKVFCTRWLGSEMLHSVSTPPVPCGRSVLIAEMRHD